MSQADSRTTSGRMNELATKMKESDEEMTEKEAAEMFDLIVMRASNLVAVKGGLPWDDVADQLEMSAKVARKMAEDEQ